MLRLIGLRVQMVPATGPIWNWLGVEQRQWWRNARWTPMPEQSYQLFRRRVRLARDVMIIPTGKIPHGTRWLRAGLTGKVIGRVVSFGHEAPRGIILFRGAVGRVGCDFNGVVKEDETPVIFGVWGRCLPVVQGVKTDILQVEEP